MKRTPCLAAALAIILATPLAAQEASVHVNVDNYVRAESDRQFDELLKLTPASTNGTTSVSRCRSTSRW